MHADDGLRALAALDATRAAPYAYGEFERRAARARARARSRETRLAASAAAVIVCALAGTLLYVAMRAPVRGTGSQVPATAATSRAPAVRDGDAAWLAPQSGDPAVVRVGRYATVAALEDRIALIDDHLNDSRLDGDPVAEIANLRRERARLVSALVSVRYAQSLAANLP